MSKDYSVSASIMNSIHLFLLLLSFTLLTSAQDEDTTTEEENTSEGETTQAEVMTQPPMFPQIKIVGGIIVQNREEFPYQASIRYMQQNYPFCGGTVINPTHVLTAAHCMITQDGNVISKSRIYVVVGDLRTDSPTSNTLTRDVLEIIVHEDYSTVTLQNDIALLKISSLGTFTAYVDSIELSSATPTEGTNCVVSGWGTTSAGGHASIVLQSVEVPIASLEACSVSYAGQIHDGMLCAGYVEGQRDACQGDSGGPLVCNRQLAGVVSWGYSCAQPGYPGIYTDVSQYRSWIRQNQAPEQIADYDDLDEEDTRRQVIDEYVVQNRAYFSYQASLRYSSKNYHFCGATIIDVRHVVTAAHCVVDRISGDVILPETLSVTVGDLNVREESASTIYRQILEIYVHENFRPLTLENDIAVLKVGDFEQWTDTVSAVALAIRTPADNAVCVTSGWGARSLNGSYNDVLRSVNIPILNSTVCHRYFQDGMKDGTICAGDTDHVKRICQLDSGGPLVCDYQLAGIVSWGFNCSLIGSPSVYTNIASYNEWILEQVRKSTAVNVEANLRTLALISIGYLILAYS